MCIELSLDHETLFIVC
jgi:hypothetical protein